MTVSVLNGTGVPGRATALGDQLQAAGFRLGNIANHPARQSESVVVFTNGHARDARAVARWLGISQIRRMHEAVETLTGPAAVPIIVGPDLVRQPHGD